MRAQDMDRFWGFIAHKRKFKRRKGHLEVRLAFLVTMLGLMSLLPLIKSTFFPSPENFSLDLDHGRHTLEVLPELHTFTHDELRNGAVLLHVIGLLYAFVGIAIVCDDYFEAALERICVVLDLKKDVAGATFMAAGSSAPELFTSLMGTFAASNDVGVGTIVGSAVFNVLIIVGCVGVAADGVRLSWYPLTRDSTFYCITVIWLVIITFDSEIRAWECAVCLVLYCCYVTVMYFNERIHAWMNTKIAQDADKRPTALKLDVQHFVLGTPFVAFISMIILVNVSMLVLSYQDDNLDWPDIVNHTCSIIFILEFIVKLWAFGSIGFWADSYNAFDGVLVILIVLEYILSYTLSTMNGTTTSGLRSFRLFRLLRAMRSLRCLRVVTNAGMIRRASLKGNEIRDEADISSASPLRVEGTLEEEGVLMAGKEKEQEMSTSELPNAANCLDDSEKPLGDVENPSSEQKPVGKGCPAPDAMLQSPEANEEGGGGDGGGENDDDDDDEDGPSSPFDIPDGLISKVIWAMVFPLRVLMWATIPDCSEGGKPNSYMFTFLGSIFWICGLSYFMVWMVVIFGEVIGMDSAFMGLTVLAAGTSVPDTLASVNVARKGFGDMAVSNSIGSNVFDILIGLGFPWLLKTLSSGETVPIISTSMNSFVMLLLLTVALLIVGVHFNGWRLTKQFSCVLFGTYIGFVVLILQWMD